MATVRANLLQSCLTLWEPMDYNLPGFSMVFSRQEHWSGLPCPPPGDFPDSGITPALPASLALQAGSLPLGHLGGMLCMIFYKRKIPLLASKLPLTFW